MSPTLLWFYTMIREEEKEDIEEDEDIQEVLKKEDTNKDEYVNKKKVFDITLVNVETQKVSDMPLWLLCYYAMIWILILRLSRMMVMTRPIQSLM